MPLQACLKLSCTTTTLFVVMISNLYMWFDNSIPDTSLTTRQSTWNQTSKASKSGHNKKQSRMGGFQWNKPDRFTIIMKKNSLKQFLTSACSTKKTSTNLFSTWRIAGESSNKKYSIFSHCWVLSTSSKNILLMFSGNLLKMVISGLSSDLLSVLWRNTMTKEI